MPAPSSSSVFKVLPFSDTTAPELTRPSPVSTPNPNENLASVRISNAAVDVPIAGAVPAGFKMPLTGQMRWASRLLRDEQLVNYDFGWGVNWLCGLTPYLSPDGSALGVGFAPDVAYWFDQVNGGYLGKFAAKQLLWHDDQTHIFTLAMPDGTLWKFLDLSGAAGPPGEFKSLTTTESKTVEVTEYTGTGHVANIQWSYLDGGSGMSVTVTERIHIYWTLLPGGSERVESVRWITRTGAGPETVVQQQRHTYYGAGDPHGNEGDLKTVSLVVPPLSGSPVVQHYLRYYTGTAGGAGFQHGLKYHLGPAAVNGLLSDPQFTTLDSASDSLVANYADNFFQYGAGQRATRSDVAAGRYDFAVAESPFADGYNNWRTKTTVTEPGSVQRIRFSNHIQQMMLTNLNGDRTYCRYHDESVPNGACLAALEILLADPTNVAGYNESQADLAAQLEPNQGRVDEKSYYDDTGQAPGYVHQTWHRTGTAGQPQDLKTYQYGQKTVNGVTVYYVTSIT